MYTLVSFLYLALHLVASPMNEDDFGWVWGVGVEAEGDRTKGGLKISARCRILNQSERGRPFLPLSPPPGDRDR